MKGTALCTTWLAVVVPSQMGQQWTDGLNDMGEGDKQK
jgi:hypothetical protein